jgi:ribosome assembly protein 3
VKPATTKNTRKRNRKRRRRLVSSSEPSSSSSSEDTSSELEDEEPTTVKRKTQVPVKSAVSEASSSSSGSSDSESDSESGSESNEGSIHPEDDIEMIDAPVPSTERTGKRVRIVYSRSPSPIPPPVPSFLPTKPDGSVNAESEQQLRDRFRKFWMQSVADAFQDDLGQIHKVSGGFSVFQIWFHSSLP